MADTGSKNRPRLKGSTYSSASTQHGVAHSDTIALEGAAVQGAPAVPAAVEQEDALIGRVLVERYSITRKIGQGGMGAVYEAEHVGIGKRVAVKVLLPKYSDDQPLVARLEQEARLASAIGHENIIDITDIGKTEDNLTFVVMQYLDGESLAERLASTGPMPVAEIVGIARQIASALGAAHAKGIIHRDLKPDNVFLEHRRGRTYVKVVDFGISKAVFATDGVDSSPRLTQTGVIMGTPLYMSPEQARGDEDLDHRLDIYAFGVMLYEMATGEVPFRGSNYLKIVSQILTTEPRALSEMRPDIPEEFEAIVARAMSKSCDDRYGSMEAMEHDLEALELINPTLTTSGMRAYSGTFQRKAGRSKRVWAMATTFVFATAVAVAVVLLNSSGSGVPAPQPVAIVPSDAAPPPPVTAAVPDAALPPKPTFETVRIRVVTVPKGALIYTQDGARAWGRAPIEIPLVKENTQEVIIARLKGHNDAVVTINPVLDGSEPVRIELSKGRKRIKLSRKPLLPTSKPPKSNAGDDTAGGDLTGDPYGD